MDTDHLSLPLLAAAQAQKHVTHNEALIALDALVHLAVLDIRNTPPGAPAEGNRHLVGPSPTGAFAGQAGQVAAFQDGAWTFFAPRAGWIAWLASEAAALVHDGSAWIDLKPRSADTLGINASADTTNRLAVASPAVLFNHAGAGSQVKVNKATAGDTASLLFQTDYSGRVEIGTAGDDKLHLKVSADGAGWSEAMVVDPAAGWIGIGTASPQGRLHVEGDVLLAPNYAAIGAGSFRAIGIPAASSNWNLAGASIQFWQGGFNDISNYITFNTHLSGSSAGERMRLDEAGRLGIGTTTPAVKLDVDGPARIKSYAVAALPAAGAGAGQIIFVSDESGGPVLAFSDGTNWRRVTDRAVVS